MCKSRIVVVFCGVLVLASASLLGCGAQTTRASEPSSTTVASDGLPRASQTHFKGMELYSWRDASGEWRYSLIVGKNSQWNAEAVKSAPMTFDELQTAIARLAVGEWVCWEGYEYPPTELTDALQRFAGLNQIVLFGGPYD
jgi:hypothetical protein